MFFKCTEEDFRTLAEMGFVLDPETKVPLAFPEGWRNTGNIGICPSQPAPYAIFAGEFTREIIFSSNNSRLRTTLVALAVFSDEFMDDSSMEEGDFLVYFEGV